MKTCGLLVVTCIVAAACAPSRDTLFDPVRSATVERAGVEPHWTRSPAVEKRVRELAAAPLTPDSAALIATLNSPVLQAVYEDLATAGAAVAEARTPRNPEAEAAIRFPIDHGGDAELELLAVQDVTSLFALIPRSEVAGAELHATRDEVVARTVSLAARARVALYDAAAAAARLELRSAVAESASAAAELSRKLHQAGNLSDLDLTRDSLFEEDALLALRRAQADAAAARETLGVILGLGGDGWRLADGVLETPAPKVPVGELERESVDASLELAAARARLEAADGKVGVARFESFVPRLGAGVSALREGDGGWHAGPAVTLSVPIFDWGQGKRAAASAELRRRREEYTAAGVELRATARTAAESLRAAEDRLARVRDRLLPLRLQLLAEGVKQYNAMNLGPFELLQLRREQIDIEEKYIDALRDAWVARTAVWQLRAGSRPRS